MGYYIARCKNIARDGNPKRTSAGRGTLGVSAAVELDTNAQDIVGIDMWWREYRGEPMLQVQAIGNGYNVNRSGETLFDGTIDEFVCKLKGGAE